VGDDRNDRAGVARIRWAIRATLALAITASITANVLHARPTPVAQAIAAWPPLALLLTVELIARVPAHRRWLSAVRLFAAGGIAAIAAWVSYWHMAAVAARYGETGTAGYLLPLSVDGLVVVASISLVELAGRTGSKPAATVRTAATTDEPATAPRASASPASTTLATARPASAFTPARPGLVPIVGDPFAPPHHPSTVHGGPRHDPST
jgi:Protein of unknown function (DUF2637)